MWSAVGGVGATAALLIGGPLTDGPGWEWIFYLDIPVALAMLALSPIRYRSLEGVAEWSALWVYWRRRSRWIAR